MKEFFKDLLDISKLMKLKDGDYIMVSTIDNNIINLFGIDESMNYIKTFECENKYTDPIFNQCIITISFLKYIFENDINEKDLKNFYIENVGFFVVVNELAVFNSVQIKINILNKYNTLMRYLEPSSLSFYNNFGELRGNENFENILLLKSADGARPFIIDRYIMYMFTGLLTVNKSDMVNLEIYDRYDLPYFLSNFKITKKKKTINNYIFYYRL